MCNFFSCVSDGKGKVMYFDWELRKKCLSGELNYDPDSHTSIADYFGHKGAMEDVLNKWEYNPLTKVFKADQINTNDDSVLVRRFVEQLDWKKVVEPLILKPIVNPFSKDRKRVVKKDIALLKEWDSVGDSVWDSVWASVWGSVWDSVWASVWGSVWGSVWDSVRASVGGSVWGSVRASVGDSVWAYMGTFFDLPEWRENYPFQPAVDLWERGLVPSYDGKVWRLHAKSGVLWEGEVK